jgi:hypothetical protein
MVEVDRPRDESERLQRELAAKAGMTIARRSQPRGDEIVRLEDQVRLFLEEFPGGFQDPAYVKKHRGTSARGARGHHDPSVATAKRLLAQSELSELVAAYRHDAVIERVVELLDSTSLVDQRQLILFKALDERAAVAAVAALNELLYGEGDMALAMQKWIDSLAAAGMGVSWALATAVPALVQPDKHLCVRESVLSQQARWLSPRLQMTKVPNGKVYARFCAMAVRLLAELGTHGLSPRDLLDGHEFMWLTLRPAARKRIAAMVAPPRDPTQALPSSVELGTQGETSAA